MNFIKKNCISSTIVEGFSALFSTLKKKSSNSVKVEEREWEEPTLNNLNDGVNRFLLKFHWLHAIISKDNDIGAKKNPAQNNTLIYKYVCRAFGARRKIIQNHAQSMLCVPELRCPTISLIISCKYFGMSPFSSRSVSIFWTQLGLILYLSLSLVCILHIAIILWYLCICVSYIFVI